MNENMNNNVMENDVMVNGGVKIDKKSFAAGFGFGALACLAAQGTVFGFKRLIRHFGKKIDTDVVVDAEIVEDENETA